MIVVEKYGGSSVASIPQLKDIAEHVNDMRNAGHQLVIVASAMGKMTNTLLHMASNISEHCNARELDSLLSTGEQQTITLLAMAIEKLDIPVVSLTGLQCGIKTTNQHSSAKIIDIEINTIKQHLNAGKVVVIAGFQGVSSNGDITTLGRGGSDTTAVAIAAKLGCECNIYTDVNGVYAIDPRIYANPKHINTISYAEMMQMSGLGTGVLETRSVEIAQKYHIPLYLGKALEKDKRKGTYIMETTHRLEDMPITGISIKQGYEIITISDIPDETEMMLHFMENMANMNINLDYVKQQKNSDQTTNFMILCSTEQSNRIQRYDQKFHHPFPISYQTSMISVSLIGIGILTHSGLVAKALRTLKHNNIPYEMLTTSELSISFVMNETYMKLAGKAFVEAFQLQEASLKTNTYQNYRKNDEHRVQ